MAAAWLKEKHLNSSKFCGRRPSLDPIT